MFTCMDITMALGVTVAGGIFSGQLHSFSVRNKHVEGDFFKEEERGPRESISQWGHNKSLLS